MNINQMAIIKGVTLKKDGIEVKLQFAKNSIEADDLMQLGGMVGKKDPSPEGEVDALVDVTMGAVQEELPLNQK